MATAKSFFNSVWFRVVLVLICAFGIALRSADMTDMGTRSPDEYTYTSYAASLADGGFAAYRKTFADYNRDPRMWEHPSPSRIGSIGLAAAVMAVSGVRNARAGAAVSWFFSVMSLVLVAFIGVRFFSRPVALLAVAFLASSFTELALARRAWQDSTAGFFGLALFAVTCAILRSPHRRRLYLLFFAVATFTLLNKETGWIAYAVCGTTLFAFAAVHLRSMKLSAALVAGALASIAMALAVLSLLAGGPAPVLVAEGNILRGRVESPYVLVYSGPWYQFFYLLWSTGPLTAVMAAIGVVAVALSTRHLGAPAVAALLTSSFIGMAAFGYRLQCLRLTSPADGAYCLLAAVGLWYLYSAALKAGVPSALLTAATVLIVAFSTLRDVHEFRRVVVKSDTEDLAAREILMLMRR